LTRNLICERKDISEFILGTKETLDGVGVKLVAEALETIDEVYKNSKARIRNWTVKSKDYKKTFYLSDEAVGILIHDKLDSSVKN
jgi:hypothetical protein